MINQSRVGFHRGKVIICVATLVLLLMPALLPAQATFRRETDPINPLPESIILPFAFYSDSAEFALGLGGATSGQFQPQALAAAAAFGSSNGSYGLFLSVRDVQIQPVDRLFVDFRGGLARWADINEWVDGNPQFPNQQAGSNGSSDDNFVPSDTLMFFGEFNLKYVLPIGDGKGDPIAHYVLNRGKLASGATGGHSWNPLESGRTFVEVLPFGDWRSLDAEYTIPQDDYNTSGLRFAVRWDNTDFPLNPSRGNALRVQLSRDFSVLGSSGQYTTLEGEYAQYVPLGTSDWFRQQVLALSVWTIGETAGSAPYYTGAMLGGYNRMRAFPFNRFSGTAALYGCAELRLMPDWNPLSAVESLEKVARVDWMQFALFGEVGRVADNYSTELFDDPQWDVGIGIRLLARKSLLRVDFAYGDEGGNLWLMIGQAF